MNAKTRRYVESSRILLFVFLMPLCASRVVFAQAASQSRPDPAGPVVKLNASDAEANAPKTVAPLSHIGKEGALEEATAKLGLSFRPWDGREYRDYSWIYRPGETFSFRLGVPAAAGCTRAVLNVWNWRGKIVYTREYASLPVDDVLAVKPECHGVWMVTLDAYGDSKGASLKGRLVKSFGTPVDASADRAVWREKNDYRIGSCFFPCRYYQWGKKWKFGDATHPELTPAEGIDRIAALAARAGLTMLRIDTFARSEKPGGKADWDTQTAVLDILRKHQIQADFKLRLFPDCFVGATLERNAPVFASWEEDLDYIISHYLQPGDAAAGMVELGNEPAHLEFWKGTREQYEYLVKYARAKILKANSSLMVVHGASCPPGADLSGERLADPAAYEAKRKKQEQWYLDFYRDLAGEMNVWAYHQHGPLKQDTLEWRSWERTALARVGFTGAYMQTEGGGCAWRPDFDATLWASLIQKIIYSWSCGEKGWLQYNLTYDTTPGRYGNKEGWTLFHARDFAPKYQYAAVAAMVHVMAGCTLEDTLYFNRHDSGISLAVLFKHPKGRLVVWYGDPAGEPLELLSDAKAMSVFDGMGNERPLPGGKNVRLRFEQNPQYLLFTGATGVEEVD